MRAMQASFFAAAAVHLTLTKKRTGEVLFSSLGTPAGLELVEEQVSSRCALIPLNFLHVPIPNMRECGPVQAHCVCMCMCGHAHVMDDDWVLTVVPYPSGAGMWVAASPTLAAVRQTRAGMYPTAMGFAGRGHPFALASSTLGPACGAGAFLKGSPLAFSPGGSTASTKSCDRISGTRVLLGEPDSPPKC